MNSLYIITYAIWFLSEILLNRFFRSKKTDKQNADKGSLYLIWIFIIIGIFSAVFVSLLSFVGFGISLNNWISLIIVTILVLIAFIIRIKIEEKILIEYFGTEYLDYKKKTKGIIPFIY